MTKTPEKTNLLTELNNRKKEAQKSGIVTAAGFNKFMPAKSRYEKKSPVGPCRGGRKGN